MTINRLLTVIRYNCLCRPGCSRRTNPKNRAMSKAPLNGKAHPDRACHRLAVLISMLAGTKNVTADAATCRALAAEIAFGFSREDLVTIVRDETESKPYRTILRVADATLDVLGISAMIGAFTGADMNDPSISECYRPAVARILCKRRVSPPQHETFLYWPSPDWTKSTVMEMYGATPRWPCQAALEGALLHVLETRWGK